MEKCPKSSSRLYAVWASMKERCKNKNHPAFKRYGGRGITVCKEWDEDFLAFEKWAMANGYDPDAPRGQCTIDRIDNDGNYCPENCRWVDMQVQSENRSQPNSQVLSKIGVKKNDKQTYKQNTTLYDIILALCKSRNITGGKMCTDIGISKGLLTDLKKGRRSGVSAVTAQKIASYFNVTVGYLLGEESEEITKNTVIDRIKILCEQKRISLNTAFVESGVGKNFKSNLKNANPSMGKLTMLANYFDVSVGYLLGEKLSEKNSKEAELKMVLFGRDIEVTDEMWNEVMKYAEYIKHKYGTKNERSF